MLLSKDLCRPGLQPVEGLVPRKSLARCSHHGNADREAALNPRPSGTSQGEHLDARAAVSLPLLPQGKKKKTKRKKLSGVTFTSVTILRNLTVPP